MAEMVVKVEGVTPTANGAMSVANTITTPIYVAQGMVPGLNIYTTLVGEAPGVVAANNFMSIFNPISSGKIFIVYQFVCFPYAGAASTATGNMNVHRVTAASGGTLRAASDINKFVTTEPNSVAEVRTGNPTVTILGTTPILAIPPAITSAGSGVSATVNIIPPSGAVFHVLPGEGIVARTTAGDVDQLWSLGFTWGEATL